VAETLTGPPYPLVPVPGTNSIGKFDIGESPVGDIPPFNPWLTIQSEYGNSPRITGLILNLFSYINQTQNFDAFYDNIMNIETAQGYGLDTWGRIVGVNRVLQVQTLYWFGFAEALPGDEGFNYPSVIGYGPSFGFEEALPNSYAFNQGPFGFDIEYLQPNNNGGGPYYSGETLTSNFALSDQSYRTLILAKAAANITNGSIPAINQILMNLFPNRGNAFVTEGSAPSTPFFGFEESTNANPFNQGVFYEDESVATMTMTYTFLFALSPVEIAIVEQSGVLPKPVGVKAITAIAPL
jgi:hypothetical protein